MNDTHKFARPGAGHAARVRADAALAWLGEFNSADAGRFGNKAATLSELSRDFRVPLGFSVAGAATPRSDVPGLRELIGDAYCALAKQMGSNNPPVAVRSSGAGEDSKDASHAGIFDTFLGVVGVDAVVDAVLRCRDVARAERLVTYRQRLGLAAEQRPIPVLVQQLIEPDASIVAFSTDPVRGRGDEILIEATWGLGEPLVGGTVSPDVFRVTRATLEIRGFEIGRKETMLVPAYPGTREVGVPYALRTTASLERSTVLEIARLALELERRCGTPVDIECAAREQHLYLLQCRPITTTIAQA